MNTRIHTSPHIYSEEPAMSSFLQMLKKNGGKIALALLAVGTIVAALISPSLFSPSSISKIPKLPAAAILSDIATTTEPADLFEQPTFYYLQVIKGCGPYYNDTPCVNMRSGPGTSFPIVNRLRTGVVLKVEKETIEGEGKRWYKIIYDGEIRYPERVEGNWYIAFDPTSVELVETPGDEELIRGKSPLTQKHIVVDRSEQMLYAYDGDTLFMQEAISTGLDGTPTPRGTFTVFRKTPSRYMQGPLPGVSDQVYDLPGVPWNMYFTADGAVIHGAYWHDHFGTPWSHGCVNMPLEKAKELYFWGEVGMKVLVQE